MLLLTTLLVKNNLLFTLRMVKMRIDEMASPIGEGKKDGWKRTKG